MTRFAKVGVGAVCANIAVQVTASVACPVWGPLSAAQAVVFGGVALTFAAYFYLSGRASRLPAPVAVPGVAQVLA